MVAASSVLATLALIGGDADFPDSAAAGGAASALFALLFAWVGAGFVTALMGFKVALRGDRYALGAAASRRADRRRARARRS